MLYAINCTVGSTSGNFRQNLKNYVQNTVNPELTEFHRTEKNFCMNRNPLNTDMNL